MTFMKVKALVISVLILTGCATADIVPIGRDTYIKIRSLSLLHPLHNLLFQVDFLVLNISFD